MNIIVCMPDSQCSEQICNLLWEWGNELQHRNEIMIHTYQSSEDLLISWEKGLLIDILFIADEIANDLSGFEVAHHIQDINWYMPIVLVVKHPEIHFDHYHFETLRFLFCPIKKDVFTSCMNMCWIQAQEKGKEVILLKDRNQIIRVRTSAITFIEHSQRHTEIHVADREKPYVVNSTLQQICRSLPEDQFLRSHKSFIVNKQYISEIQNGAIIVHPGCMIPIGRTYHSLLVERLLKEGSGSA